VRELFLEACELSVQKRAAFLDWACGDDAKFCPIKSAAEFLIKYG
jgi:hypothetical protein